MLGLSASKKYLGGINIKAKRHKCSECGEMVLESDMKYDSNPYAEDVLGDSSKMWICNSCRREMSRGI